MSVARRGRHHVAGLVAAVPTITAPTLAWLAAERGAEFAARAAVGSVAACAMLALFALGYSRAATRHGAPVALGCGLAGLGLMALPAFAASARLADAVLLALGCCALALAGLPRHGAFHPAPAAASNGLAVPTAAASGGLTAVSATLGPLLGGFATGLLSSLPLVTGSVAVIAHTRSGPQAAQRFLHGYLEGLFGKIAFGAVFAVLVTRVGMPAAMALACPAAIVVPLLRRPAWGAAVALATGGATAAGRLQRASGLCRRAARASGTRRPLQHAGSSLDAALASVLPRHGAGAAR